MTPVFVDTSAIYAFLDRNDANHKWAVSSFQKLLENDYEIQIHSFALLETIALLQNRLGMDAVETFRKDLQEVLEISWVDRSLYEEAMQKLLQSKKRKISLVDQTSFLFMKREKIEEVFAFDADFEEEGFRLFKSGDDKESPGT